MDRRTFVAGAAVAGAALAAGMLPRPARAGVRDALSLSAPPRERLKRIGLELYSVRDAMRADPDATLAKVRAMGYDDVELLWSFDNFGRTAQQVRAALEKEGLEAPAAHIAPETLLGDWEQSIETARYLGHRYLIVPSLPAETNRSLDAWRTWADRFNNAGALANRGGIWLAFHNEPGHMRRIDGVVPYDLFLQRTDPRVVRHQLDFGNMLMGGGDPLAYLRRHRDRYFSFHVKDVIAAKTSDTELGAGIVDIKACLAAIPDIHDKPCFVEQEGQEHPLDSAAKNYLYLKSLEF